MWEWCWGWYSDYRASAQTDPWGASGGSGRVNRGSSGADDADYLRAADRYRAGAPSYRSDSLGFRPVRAVE